MSVLIKQNTAKMIRKQYWGAMAKAASVLVVWGATEFYGISVTATAAAAFTGIVGMSVGYWVKERA